MNRDDAISLEALEARIKALEDRLNKLAPKDTTKFALKDHTH